MDRLQKVILRIQKVDLKRNIVITVLNVNVVVYHDYFDFNIPTN